MGESSSFFLEALLPTSIVSENQSDNSQMQNDQFNTYPSDQDDYIQNKIDEIDSRVDSTNPSTLTSPSGEHSPSDDPKALALNNLRINNHITNFYTIPIIHTYDTSVETKIWMRMTPIMDNVLTKKKRKSSKNKNGKKSSKPIRSRFPASQNYPGQISRAYSRFLIKRLSTGQLDLKSFLDSQKIPLNSEFKEELVLYIKNEFHGKKIGKSVRGIRQETSKVNNSKEIKKVFHLDFEDNDTKRMIKLFLKQQLVEFFKPENFINWLRDDQDCQISPNNKAFYKKNRLELFKAFMGEVNKCKFQVPSDEELFEFRQDPAQMISY